MGKSEWWLRNSVTRWYQVQLAIVLRVCCLFLQFVRTNVGMVWLSWSHMFDIWHAGTQCVWLSGKLMHFTTLPCRIPQVIFIYTICFPLAYRKTTIITHILLHKFGTYPTSSSGLFDVSNQAGCVCMWCSEFWTLLFTSFHMWMLGFQNMLQVWYSGFICGQFFFCEFYRSVTICE